MEEEQREVRLYEAHGIVINGVAVDRALWYVDKTGWGPGDWAEEPDKVQWVDPSTGLDCLAVRHPEMGHWCGYCGVPPGHPAHGLDYDAAGALAPPDVDGDRYLAVHGGTTFAGPCDEEGGETGVCHVPQEGRPDEVWWIGFDACHAGDLSPGTAALLRAIRVEHVARWPESVLADDKLTWLLQRDEYRTLGYVMSQCKDLARQLAAYRPVAR